MSQNLQITSISETDESNTLVRTDENTYSAVIPLSRINLGATNTVRIEIEWVDNEQNSEGDIAIGMQEDPVLEIPITVHVCQYLGETLTAYTEP